ncbi:carboxypeptidase regulatory-like domain-containing protein [Streptomyces sp. MI02-7b]|uniref:carboxypeptidase regulatory-like domain-containing protein n=1 Tax=Streptomyces sp. MI02-7b TaxID=462941 RepID=UPI0029AC29E9|nr:carboxypeptidase regulatory-like domain-containing protein [Streptomyces sp. MI02-7b]MDX3072689.1 carboxypeptidase regulatory-like domain-containing protein [Streptomyces sp. MI02-7b]
MSISPSARSAAPAFRAIGRAAAVLGVAALAALGLQPAAQARPTTPVVHAVTHAARTTAAPDTAPDLEPVCDAPAKGRAACYALRATGQPPLLRLGASATPAGLGPQDIQSAYNLPADGGAGQTIAIVDAYDNPNAEADLAVYRQQYGLSPCTTANGCFRKVDQRGGTSYPQPSQGWAGEIALDLDMVSAAAPGAHILLVETDNDGLDNLAAGVDEAVSLGAKYVSNSYGRPGDSADDLATYGASYDHPGVAVVAASGDNKYGVSFPSTLPTVTAVGGTTLTADPGSARGWSETVWARDNYGPGSGCAQNQVKPAFQKDTGCTGRSVADVSAVADNVAVYLTFGDQGTGWQRYGGTSVATPVIASLYALAGPPRPGTYPNAYPYAAGGAGLNDVTTGSNGTCAVAYLCTGGPGYDGPTGLGTPAGLAAFRSGPHGTLSGTVKDAATGKPVARATVGSGLDVTTTDTEGAYTLDLPAGTVKDLTVKAFGYTAADPVTLTVADGQSLTRDVALTPIPREHVRGTVTDGSGHGWPLYAKITVAGSPEAPVWTDPVTGAYRLDLPQGADYTLDVTSSLPGYEAREQGVTVGHRSVTADVALTADPDAATAVGYSLERVGGTETFDSTAGAPQGWSVVNAPGTDSGWEFDDPIQRGNLTGGSGAFAVAESDNGPIGPHQDSQLISPVYDFSAGQSAELSFRTEYGYNPNNQQMSVDVTTDGGATWTNAWASPKSSDTAQNRTLHVALGAFAGHKAVQLRFHFVANWGYHWAIDDVFVATRTLVPTPGGLAVGTVSDANTHAGLVGATVTDLGNPQSTATTTATPEDPAVGDGFYTLFAAGPGKHTLGATASGYATATERTTVRADRVTRTDLAPGAGRVTATPQTISGTVVQGRHTTARLRLANTGTAPVTVRLAQASGTGWLTPGVFQVTLEPGRRTTVTLVLDSASPDVTAPGDYRTQITLTGDTPYAVAPVPVTLHVTAAHGHGA